MHTEHRTASYYTALTGPISIVDELTEYPTSSSIVTIRQVTLSLSPKNRLSNNYNFLLANKTLQEFSIDSTQLTQELQKFYTSSSKKTLLEAEKEQLAVTLQSYPTLRTLHEKTHRLQAPRNFTFIIKCFLEKLTLDYAEQDLALSIKNASELSPNDISQQILLTLNSNHPDLTTISQNATDTITMSLTSTYNQLKICSIYDQLLQTLSQYSLNLSDNTSEELESFVEQEIINPLIIKALLTQLQLKENPKQPTENPENQ